MYIFNNSVLFTFLHRVMVHLGSLKRGMQEIDETPLPPPPPSPKKDETTEAQRKVSRKERCCPWKISRKQNRKNAVKRNCLRGILCAQDLVKARTDYWKWDREEQGQWLLHFFSFGQRVKNGKKGLQYIHCKEVCQKAWIYSHGLSYGR